MSDERAELERLRKLKRLRELQAKEAGAASPSAPDVPSAGRSGVLGFAQGGTFGFADEMGGLVAKLLTGDSGVQLGSGAQPSPDDTPEVRAAKTRLLSEMAAQPSMYQLTRDRMRAENAAAETSHGGYYLGGNLLGGLATAPLLPGLGTGKTLGQLMLQGMKVGAATGAAAALGLSNADLTRGDFGGAALDTAAGGLLGGALGGALPPLAAGVGWGARNIGAPIVSILRGGYVKPTPEARRLMEQGAKMTLGQAEPGALFGRAEELAMKSPIGGPLESLRSQGEGSIRDVVLSAARAEGARPPTMGAPVKQQIQELKSGFGQLFDDALEGVKIEPATYMGKGKWRGLLTDDSIQGAAKTKGAFELAANDRNIIASADVRKNALDWLSNKATILQPTKSGPNAGTVPARAVHTLKSNIGKQIAKLKRSTSDEAMATVEILTRAKDFVTELLEAGLPPERLSTLRRAEASYGDFLAVKDAAKKAFVDNQEFTAAQLLRIIGNKGATPELEAVARDAHAVLNPTYTPTGLQGTALSQLPGFKYLAGPWASVANFSPGWRAHALKQAIAPGIPAKALTATGRALEGAALQPRGTSTASRFLYDLLHGPGRDQALTPVEAP